MKVHVTLYNAETMIGPCLEAVRKVYPDVIVHDFGSEDSGPEIVAKMGIPIEDHGRLSGEEYVFLKEEISCESPYVFWIDADEVWPEHCLENIEKFTKEHKLVIGFWRNLKVRGGIIYVSDFLHRGVVAWDTKYFQIHRTWPREKIRARFDHTTRKDEEFTPENKGELFCWHGVLLNVSHLPDKKNRWKKRAERDDQCANLVWAPLEDLPFYYDDKRILEIPKFVWYK